LLFALGTIGFPWVKYYPLMLICRIMTGLGAGTVFLGVVKLIGDLYSEKFAMVLGTIMFCSYFGPSCGTTPMVKLTEMLSWKISMSIPGIVAALGVAVIIAFCAGTIKPVERGENIQPLLKMLKNRAMWLVSLSTPVIFGAYYILTSQLGQKSISDHCKLPSATASTVILGLTILVAVNNVAGNLLLKLCGNRRKMAAIWSFAATLLGTVLGYAAFRYTNSLWAVAAAYVLIAIPAGFFPIFSLMAKELNPPEQTGLAVAVLNFWCFVYIAAFQNISGRILQNYAVTGEQSYPPEAYCGVFIFLTIMNLCALIASCFYKETRPKQA
jgi:MFS family permease